MRLLCLTYRDPRKQTNTSLLSCVGCHAMRSTWHESGVERNLLSDKSVPQRELRGEIVPPRLSRLSAVMRSPSRSPRRVSWFKDHKISEPKSPAFKTLSHGGSLSVNHALARGERREPRGMKRKEEVLFQVMFSRIKPLKFCHAL